MLATRLATGLTLVAVLLAVLILDERLAPWFPLWFLTSMVVMASGSMELVGLLDATSARPSGNTVFGGTMALVLANWAPHLVRQLEPRPRPAGPAELTTRRPSIDVMAWPLWTFVAVLMAAFLSQSLQFRRPGQTMATIAGTILAIAYVGLLGGFIIQMPLVRRAVPRPDPAGRTWWRRPRGRTSGPTRWAGSPGRNKLWPRLSPNKTIEGADRRPGLRRRSPR